MTETYKNLKSQYEALKIAGQNEPDEAKSYAYFLQRCEIILKMLRSLDTIDD